MNLTTEEQELIQSYRAMTDRRARFIYRFAGKMAELTRNEQTEQEPKTLAPVIRLVVDNEGAQA